MQVRSLRRIPGILEPSRGARRGGVLDALLAYARADWRWTAARIAGRFECRRCGWCCRELEVWLEDDEVRRLARYLQTTPSEVKRLLNVWEVAGGMYVTRAPCPFLETRDGQAFCAAYPARPETCRLAPFRCDAAILNLNDSCALAQAIRLKLIEFCMDWLRGDWTPPKTPYRWFEEAVFNRLGLNYPGPRELLNVAEGFIFGEAKAAGARLPDGKMFIFFAPLGFWRLFDSYLPQAPAGDEWLRRVKAERRRAEKRLKIMLRRGRGGKVTPLNPREKADLFALYGAWGSLEDLAAGFQMIQLIVKTTP